MVPLETGRRHLPRRPDILPAETGVPSSGAESPVIANDPFPGGRPIRAMIRSAG
jgi:hypothetical protein